MQVTLEIPDEVARQLPPDSVERERVILENFAVEAYRRGILSTAEIRKLLGHASRWETESFLSAHDAWPGTTIDEVTEDMRALQELLRK
jgi:hypothetical protein